MPGLDGAAILSVWERGSVQQLGKRALTLLQLAGISSAEACALPAGTRDATLLRIRLRLFGDRIEGVASCDACGEELDLTLSVAQLLGGMPFAETTLRVPNAGDLAAIASAGDDETGVTLLLERLRPDIEPAPEWIQRWGLEWAIRLAQEPGRVGKRYLRGLINWKFKLAVGS